MKIKSYPKVNLNLFVKGKDKGLHILDSILVEVEGDLYDELEISIEEGYGLDVTSNVEIKNNNLYKCYELMKTKIDKKINVNINKNIPMMGGLGGGSSNAAAFINSLNKLFNMNLEYSDLVAIAEQVGSDVPFFINGGVARVQGTGNIITQLNVKPPKINLYTNQYKLSTKEVFDNFIMEDCNKDTMDEMIKALEDNKVTNDLIVNDLQNAIFKTDNKYADFVKKENKSISGSGSTLFKLI